MASANSFLEMAKKEAREARARADPQLERQAAEKFFHALEEALTGRIQKYGLKPSNDHVQLRNDLASKGDKDLAAFYWDCYLRLHVGMWYKGVIEPKVLDSFAKRIEETVHRVERDMRRR
jgi:hypothetical protein